MIRHIHPLQGNNKNPGTRDRPWKDLANLSSQPWDEALIARDTTLILKNKVRLDNLSNKVIGNYGAGERPVIHHFRKAENWKHVRKDIWASNISNFWNPVVFLCFGKLGTHGKRTTFFDPRRGMKKTLPANDREWDCQNNPSLLYVYAPENPQKYYGNIYYQTARQPAFALQNVDNFLIEGLSLRYASDLAHLTNQDNKTHRGFRLTDCHAQDSAWLTRIVGHKGWIEDFEISGCSAANCHIAGLYASRYIRNSRILNNQFEDTGLVESTASIYIGDCYAPADKRLQIKGNRIERTRYSRYWPVDGAAIFVDARTQNIDITENFAFDTRIAIKSNSGKPGIRVFANFTRKCDIGYEEGDSERYDRADTRVFNNNFLDCHSSAHRDNDPLGRPVAAVRYFNKHSKNAGHHFYGNEITGSGNAGLLIYNDIDEYDNRFLGFKQKVFIAKKI